MNFLAAWSVVGKTHAMTQWRKEIKHAVTVGTETRLALIAGSMTLLRVLRS